MSEFRMFCIGLFAGVALMCAGFNHGLVKSHGEAADYLSVLIIGLMVGSLAVAIFGRRS